LNLEHPGRRNGAYDMIMVANRDQFREEGSSAQDDRAVCSQGATMPYETAAPELDASCSIHGDRRSVVDFASVAEDQRRLGIEK